MPVVCGSIDRIVFRNPDTGFCVARFRITDSEYRGEPQTTVVGEMPSVRVGEVLRLTGEWQLHPVHGPLFGGLQIGQQALAGQRTVMRHRERIDLSAPCVTYVQRFFVG